MEHCFGGFNFSCDNFLNGRPAPSLFVSVCVFKRTFNSLMHSIAAILCSCNSFGTCIFTLITKINNYLYLNFLT